MERLDFIGCEACYDEGLSHTTKSIAEVLYQNARDGTTI
jgi:hypothetical protein